MPLYGDTELDDYGDALYGDLIGTVKNVRNRVGTDFDVAINGVGLELVPDKKAYSKKAAQTFSYNPKSLFKQGDGSALVAKDLYYWSRLEHSRWDGGETYNPWQPGDASDPNRRDTHYASSYGFDTSDPYKLTHLREVRVSPSYEFVISNDSPLAYWILGDHPSSTEAYDQIASDRTPGTPLGAVTFGIVPSPIAYDPNTVALFDGVSGDLRMAKKVPFAGNVTPNAGPWSLEAWVAPTVLPQKGIIAAVGHEVIAGVSYSATIIADTPTSYWRLGEAEDPVTAIDAMGNNNLTVHYPLVTPEDLEFGVAGAVPGGDTAVFVHRGGNNGFIGGGVDANVGLDDCYNLVDNFAMEAWIKPATLPQVGTILINWGKDAPPGYTVPTPVWGMSIGEYSHGLNAWIASSNLHLIAAPTGAGVDSYDSGYTFPATGVWYHVVIERVSGTWHFYVNGAEVGTLPVTVTPVNSEREGFSIGSYASADGLMFDGNIDEVAIYGHTLTGAQIANHYGVGAPSGVAGGFAMGIAAADGSAAGSRLVVRLPGVGWYDGGYTFASEVNYTPIQWWRLRLEPPRTSPHGAGSSLLAPYDVVPSTGVWHHVVMTSSGTNVKTYVDGVLKATLAHAAISVPSYASIAAIRQLDTNNLDVGDLWFLNGQATQVAVYTTELSGAQVLAHYNAGSGAVSSTLLTAAQDYARFIETYDGKLYINQKNTKINYSTDGGVSWATVSLPGGDVTTINAVWSKGSKVYVATTTNVYLGDNVSFTAVNTGGNPVIASVTAGLYYSGQLYVGIGTSLYYVDPATGAKTQLYDTQAFNITFIEAFGGKIWFGGTAGRQTKVWTWTNSTLPPSPANGVGAQLQDGTIPYGFVVQSSIVYLNTLLLGGLIAGDSTTEGQGAVYYIEPGGSFGQLCVLGPLLSTLRGSGIDYGVRSLWGAEDRLWMGYNNLTGIGVYNFVTGAFSTHTRTTKYTAATVNAVARVKGHNLFTIKDDGNCWREGDSKVGIAMLEESEFQELPFVPKIIDGIEGMHSALNTGEQIEIQISYDKGATWQSLGTNIYDGSTVIDFPLVNTLANHWRTRVRSYRGGDASLAPEIYSHSVRFAPRNSFKHEWVVEARLPVGKRTHTGFLLTDPGSKLLAQLWQAYQDGIAVEYIDRDRNTYKCMVLYFEEVRDKFEPARAKGNQLNLAPAFHVELLEVEKVS